MSDGTWIAIIGVWSAIITELFRVGMWLLNLPRHEAEAATHLAQTCPNENILVYIDELTFYRRPSLAYAYASQGPHQAAVSLGYLSNTHRRFAAALNVQTGQVIARQRATFDRETFLAFLRSLQAAHPFTTAHLCPLDQSGRRPLALS